MQIGKPITKRIRRHVILAYTASVGVLYVKRRVKSKKGVATTPSGMANLFQYACQNKTKHSNFFFSLLNMFACVF